jgi:hypothetical protein
MSSVVPPSITLIVDTNALRSNNDVEVVSSSFAGELLEARKYANIRLVIPRICIRELLVQKSDFAESHLGKAAKSLRIIHLLTTKPTSNVGRHSILRFAIARRIIKWCKLNDAAIARLRTSKVDWDDVVRCAVWRLPPFSPREERSEKGFKDAIVLETVIQEWARQDPHLNPEVTFITGDTLLRETARNRIPMVGTFSTFESLEEWLNHLKLSFEKRSEEFTKKVLAAASAMFFTPDDPNCVFYRSRVVETIHDQNLFMFKEDTLYFHPMDMLVPQAQLFTDTLARPSALTKTKWKALSDEQVHVNPPIYIKSGDSGTVFHWRSELTLARLYEYGDPTPSYRNPPRYVRLSGFHVLWRTTVSPTAEVSNPIIENIVRAFDKAQAGADQLRRQYSLPTDLDLLVKDLLRRTGGEEPKTAEP